MKNLGFLVTDKKYSKRQIRKIVETLKRRQITRVRMKFSADEWMRTKDYEFITTYVETLSNAGFEILPCLTFVSPHIEIGSADILTDANAVEYAIFVDAFCSRLGHCFTYLEISCPAGEWDTKCDPSYNRFALTVALGALVARSHDKKVVFNCLTGTDEARLHLFSSFADRGLLKFVHVIAYQNHRGSWDDSTTELSEQVDSIRRMAKKRVVVEEKLKKQIIFSCTKMRSDMAQSITCGLRRICALRKKNRRRPLAIWLTEFGFPTVDFHHQYGLDYLERVQAAIFAYALMCQKNGEVNRIYWNGLNSQRKKPAPDDPFKSANDKLRFSNGILRPGGVSKFVDTLLLHGGPRAVVNEFTKQDVQTYWGEASINRGIATDYKVVHAEE